MMRIESVWWFVAAGHCWWLPVAADVASLADYLVADLVVAPLEQQRRWAQLPAVSGCYCAAAGRPPVSGEVAAAAAAGHGGLAAGGAAAAGLNVSSAAVAVVVVVVSDYSGDDGVG